MRFNIFFLLLLCLLALSLTSEPSLAQVRLEYYGIDDTISEDFTVNHQITLQFSEPIDNLDYQLDFPVYNLSTESRFKSDCDLLTRNGRSTISCSFSGMTGTDRLLTLKFTTKDSISGDEAKKTFKSNYGVGLSVDRIFTIIRLPEKSILASQNPNESISPENAGVLTDGRRIMVFWNINNLTAGGSLPFSVDYTFSNPAAGIPDNILAIVLIGAVVVAVIGFSVYMRQGGQERQEVTNILNEDEKAIVGILARNGGKTLQKNLVRESDFSKAKVSRLVKNLKERSVIEIEPVSGRENRIILKLKNVLMQPAGKNEETKADAS